ncbi:hypothetical protein AAHA92_04216 [Salvia divinorum]|uniref:SHSP domain-containing protein n=1 Tax=Salvia divinorum TaxID=28513 RepID=A0ABD1I0D3_SALDI
MSSDIEAWEWEGGSFSKPFSSDPWDPWDYGGAKQGPAAAANVEWRETENAHIFRLDLPGQKQTSLIVINGRTLAFDVYDLETVFAAAGVRREDLKVDVEGEDGDFLRISGGGSVVKVEGGDDEGRRVERRSGSFSRRFRLPENADVEGMKCVLEDGVLTVEMGKKEVHHHPAVRYIHIA